MYTITLREIYKAFRSLPQNQPMTHDDLLWYVKDFYHGKGFVKMDSIHYALAKNRKMFSSAKINGKRKFWISKKILDKPPNLYYNKSTERGNNK